MAELPGMASLALTHTTQWSSFFPSMCGLSPYHSGYPMSAKQEFASYAHYVCNWSKLLFCISHVAARIAISYHNLHSFHQCAVSPHHSGYPMSAKQEFMSCPLCLQWEQINVLSFPYTLPRTTNPLPLLCLLSHMSWSVLVLLELESSKLCSDSTTDRVPKY